MQPDFLIVSRRDDGSLGVSIVDSHGDHMADAKNKLNALAQYAERFGDQFIGIESVTEISDGSLRSLGLKDEGVREALAEFAGAEVKALYEGDYSNSFG